MKYYIEHFKFILKFFLSLFLLLLYQFDVISKLYNFIALYILKFVILMIGYKYAYIDIKRSVKRSTYSMQR